MQMIAEPYVRVRIQAGPEQQELLTALLAGLGYYAFEQQDNYLDAFVLREEYQEDTVRELLEIHGFHPDNIAGIAHENWNEQWEASYQPVFVGDDWEIRAPFHQCMPGYRYSLVIQPKMAFGTGHHHTTRLMLAALTVLDLKGKDVLDMGCGTGVLGIAAAKLGAQSVTGIEIEPWSCENARENATLNKVGMLVLEGDAGQINGKTFDIILANIQRNVLMDDAHTYSTALRPGGKILVSGFFDFDEPNIRQAYVAEGLEPTETRQDNGWCMVMFHKSLNP